MAYILLHADFHKNILGSYAEIGWLVPK